MLIDCVKGKVSNKREVIDRDMNNVLTSYERVSHKGNFGVVNKFLKDKFSRLYFVSDPKP
jgi:hypothetical protein